MAQFYSEDFWEIFIFFVLIPFLQLCAIAQTRLLLHDLLNGGCIEKRQLIMRSLWGQNLYENAIFVF